MPTDRCPFCNPDPARILAENEVGFALPDASPVSEGHTLVIPKAYLRRPSQHHEWHPDRG